MTAKLTKCKVCGADMAKSAKICPKCGAKNKKPFYRKWWFWLIVVLLVVGAAGSSSGEEDTPQEDSAAVGSQQEQSAAQSAQTETPAEPGPAEIAYTHYDVTELFDALSGNPLKAEKTFQDQYVEIEGYLSVIDSDGSYISVGAAPDNYDYLLQGVQCFVNRNEALLDQIIDMEIGDPIAVRGQITEIGEILGYQMDINSIN